MTEEQIKLETLSVKMDELKKVNKQLLLIAKNDIEEIKYQLNKKFTDELFDYLMKNIAWVEQTEKLLLTNCK